MRRQTMTVEQAKVQLDRMIERKVAARRQLVDAAVQAGAGRAAGVVADLEARRRPWWPELAPLTTAERVAVYRAITAGAASAEGSDHVD